MYNPTVIKINLIDGSTIFKISSSILVLVFSVIFLSLSMITYENKFLNIKNKINIPAQSTQFKIGIFKNSCLVKKFLITCRSKTPIPSLRFVKFVNYHKLTFFNFIYYHLCNSVAIFNFKLFFT